MYIHPYPLLQYKYCIQKEKQQGRNYALTFQLLEG